MTGLSMVSLGTYCVQVLLVVLVASMAAALLARPWPMLRLHFWQAVVAACIALPLLPAAAPLATSRLAATFHSAAGTVPHASRWAELAIALVLASGAALRLAWLAWGARALRDLRRHSEPARLDAPVRAAAVAVAGHVDVRVHRRLQQPVSFGLRQPVIVVPLALMRQPAEIQIAAILHECVHVARRDWVGLLVEQMLCAVLWFHPAIWWAIDRLQLAREQLVDATVVRRMGGHRAYARALLLFADRPAPAMASTLFRGHMRQRIAALAVRRPFAPARLAAASACLVAVTAAATANAAAMGSAAQRGDMVYSAGNGVSLPAVVTEVQPTYTRDAMRAKIQGRVALACVVDARGVPGRIEILTSLDREHGLDRSAVDALKQWRFKPGTKDGKPVPVRITVEMTFTLK